MADAVRLISIRRGYDPREFALVAFGGAGPLHGAELARELSIPTVIVPPNPGTTSALGCLLVDVRHDFFAMMLGDAGSIDPDAVEREFASPRGAGARAHARGGRRARPRRAAAHDRHALHGPVALARRAGRRVASSRWTRCAAPSRPSTSASTPTAARAARSRSTGSTCGRSASRRKAELARHEAGGPCPSRPSAARSASRAPTRRSTRPSTGATSCPPGAAFDGPALVEQLDSTVVVPPGVRAEVDEWLNIRMTIGEDEA